MNRRQKNRVLTANASGDLSSLGMGAYVLIRQINFPDTFTDNNKHRHADHDRIRMWDSKHHDRCFREHTGRGEMALGDWARQAPAEKVLAFCTDILKADPAIKWTGCRILGTVHRGNGFVVWTIEVFAKHPNSRMKVYSGSNAPNVKGQFSVDHTGRTFLNHFR